MDNYILLEAFYALIDFLALIDDWLIDERLINSWG